jgi:hypothetical protein
MPGNAVMVLTENQAAIKKIYACCGFCLRKKERVKKRRDCRIQKRNRGQKKIEGMTIYQNFKLERLLRLI